MYFKNSFGPNLQSACRIVIGHGAYKYVHICAYFDAAHFGISAGICNVLSWNSFRRQQSQAQQEFIGTPSEAANLANSANYWDSRKLCVGLPLMCEQTELSQLATYQCLTQFIQNTISSAIHLQAIWGNTRTMRFPKGRGKSQGLRGMHFPMRPFVACCSVFSASTIQGTLCEKSNETRLKEVFLCFFPEIL